VNPSQAVIAKCELLLTVNGEAKKSARPSDGTIVGRAAGRLEADGGPKKDAEKANAVRVPFYWTACW